MSKRRQSGNIPVHYYSEEKLEEFRDMPARARLKWLEEANALINKTLGFEKRALFDKRFMGLK